MHILQDFVYSVTIPISTSISGQAQISICAIVSLCGHCRRFVGKQICAATIDFPDRPASRLDPNFLRELLALQMKQSFMVRHFLFTFCKNSILLNEKGNKKRQIALQLSMTYNTFSMRLTIRLIEMKARGGGGQKILVVPCLFICHY